MVSHCPDDSDSEREIVEDDTEPVVVGRCVLNPTGVFFDTNIAADQSTYSGAEIRRRWSRS
jgi:hypothetical protein